MTSKVEETKPEEKKIYSEAKGIYSLLDNNKLYQFSFPLNCSIEENFVALSFLKDKLFEAIQKKIEEEKQKAEKEIKKEEVVKE